MANIIESQVFKNISATPASFTLRGGQYAVTVNASAFGTAITLQRQVADGVSWANCLANFSAITYATVNLPSGTYRLLITGASGVYVDITAIAIPL